MAQYLFWSRTCLSTEPFLVLLLLRLLMAVCQLASEWVQPVGGELEGRSQSISPLTFMPLEDALARVVCLPQLHSSTTYNSNVEPPSLADPNHWAPITSNLCPPSLRVILTACSCQTLACLLIPRLASQLLHHLCSQFFLCFEYSEWLCFPYWALTDITL